MAQLPMYQQKTRAQAPTATGADFGTGVGQAIAQLGQTVGSFGDVLIKAEDAKRESARNTFYANSTAMLEQKVEEIKLNPDWKIKDQLYKETIEGLHEQAKEYFGKDQKSYQLWAKDFNPNTIKAETQVMLNKVKLMSEEAVVDLDNNLTIFANQSAQTDNPTEQEIWRQKAHDAIITDLNNGFINQKEADAKFETFEENVQSAKIRGLIRTSPIVAYNRLQDTNDPIFGKMKAEKKEIWISRATAAYEQELRKKDIEERRTERIAKENRKNRENELSAEIDVRFSEDTLTMDWLSQNRDEMNPTDFRYAMNKLDGQIDTVINNSTYVHLSTRISNGEDVSREVNNALTNGDIDRGYYQSLRSQMQTKYDPTFKEVMGYLRGSYSGEEVIEMGERTRMSNAVRELNDYHFNNPNATRDDLYKKADDLRKRWTVNPVQMQLFELPKPLFSSSPTLQKREELSELARVTKEAHTNGEISDEIYKREVDLIRSYRNLFDEIDQGKGIQQ